MLCILHSLGDKANISSYTNDQFRINLDTNNKLDKYEEIVINTKNYQQDEEKYKNPKFEETPEINDKNVIEDVTRPESLEHLKNDGESITVQDTKIKKSRKTVHIDEIDFTKVVFKCVKRSFMEVIEDVKFLLDAAAFFNEVRRNSTDEEIPHSGSGISYNSAHNDSVESNLNLTSANGTKNSNSSHTKKVTCLELENIEEIENVEIVNATMLLKLLQGNSNITSRSSPAECFLIYFFSPYCPFSTQGSAYVNALARAVPNIPVYGLNSVDYHSLNARFGIMGTPSLVIFHNGHTVGRYNASEYSTFYLESFIRHFTNQEINSINVTSHDFKANLPSNILKSSNIALFFAWAFLLLCAGYVFLNSEFYAKLTEAVLNNWREAEAQHEHNE